jgi:hypothetical protein
VGGDSNPVISIGYAFTFIVVSRRRLVILKTDILVSDVLRLRSEKSAVFRVIGNDTNILPWRRMPVRIVISLFWAFKTVSVTVVVLSSSSSITALREVSSSNSFSNKESKVSVSGGTSKIVFNIFVSPKFESTSDKVVCTSNISFIVYISIRINLGGLGDVGICDELSKSVTIERNGVSGRTISDYHLTR